jgi:Na+/H+ antiporter NhaA
VLALLGERAPVVLKVFFTAPAIVEDKVAVS